MLAKAVAAGFTVRDGFFPQAVGRDEHFDVIAFHDVLGHVPARHDTVQACAEHLTPQGLLVVNAPSSGGFLYWLSKCLARAGCPASFERLRQVGFPSPHLHYLDSTSIRRIAVRHGLALVRSRRLPSVACAGLYSRTRYARDVPSVKAALLAAAVAAALPALAVLPPDIKVWFLQKWADR